MHMAPSLPPTVQNEIAALRRFLPPETWCGTLHLPAWARHEDYHVTFEVGEPAWGSNLSFEDSTGRRLPMVVIDSAPPEVWHRFRDDELREHQTWIVACNRKGLRNALSIARWLIAKTTPKVFSLNAKGTVVYAGQYHWQRPGWQRIRVLAPHLVASMPRHGEQRGTFEVTWNQAFGKASAA